MKKPRLSTVILSITGAFILVPVLALVTLFLLPDQWLNNTINSKGSAASGRELTVKGPITFDWDWTTPKVKFEDIRLANIEGAEDKDMVAIGSLEFSLKLWKLLTGTIDMPELTIDKPNIVLQKDKDGNANWDFPALSKNNAAADAALPDDRGSVPIIGALAVRNGSLIYKDAQTGLDVKLTIETAEGNPQGSDGQFVLKGDGTFQDQLFKIDATGGSLEDLRNTDKAYPLDLDLSMGATRITVKGTFQDPVKMTGADATLSLKGDNLADLFYLTAIPLPPSPPYSLEGALKKEGDVWAFDDFKGKVGDSNLSGNLSYDVSGERGLVKADMTSTLLDIDDVGGFIGVAPSTGKGETVSAEQKAEAAKQKASDRVLPDMPLDLSRLRTTDMEVNLKVSQIKAPGIPLENMNVRFDLKDGLLKLNPMDLGVAGGVIDGEMTLDGQKDTPDVSMDLNLKKLKLKPFFSGSQFEDFSSGTFGGRIKLAGRGKSFADVLGVSNGHITLSMAGGKISLLLVEAAGLDIGEAAGLILGDDKTTDIRCVIGDFGVKNGLLTSNAFIFDTTDSNISGSARINLKNEGLNIEVEAIPKDSSVSLRTPITVGGTMKNPSIGINPADLAAKGTAATVLGILLTPFASIIPFIELGTGEDSDCGALIAQAKSNSAKAVTTP